MNLNYQFKIQGIRKIGTHYCTIPSSLLQSIGNQLFTERVVKCSNRPSREVVEESVLEVLKIIMDMTFEEKVQQ